MAFGRRPAGDEAPEIKTTDVRRMKSFFNVPK
jgi:hypothetical protein